MGENDNVPVVSETPPVQSRQPLLPRTLSPNPLQVKRIRRKTSFVLRSDSTEDLASPHDSIFDAIYHSGGSGDENYNGIALSPLPASNPLPEGRTNDENARDGCSNSATNSATDVEFRYGHGTVLDTITEQTSCATIGSLVRSKSVDRMPKFAFLGHRDSFVLAKSPRRKQSLSMDDIYLIKRSYHDACANIEEAAITALSINKVYAEPKAPLHDPPERPSTPPGMPSWTEAQNRHPQPRRPAPQQNRLQRFLGLPASGITLSSRVPRPSGMRSVSAPLVRRAPRFRPPRGAYGPIDQHPFNSAPVADVPMRSARRKRRIDQRVRFTPSATARDSEMNALRNAVESTSNVALHPTSPMEADQNVPLPPTSKRCPHRKGRKEFLQPLNHNLNHENTVPPSNEHLPSPPLAPSTSPNVPTPTSSPSRPNSALSSQLPSLSLDVGVLGESNNRPVSVSSTAHLLTEETSSPQIEGQAAPTQTSRCRTKRFFPTKILGAKVDDFCWKCQFGKACEKIDQCWAKSASCICFVCCGFDIDEEMGVNYYGRSRNAFRRYDGANDPDVLIPRRVILNSTPAVAV